MQSQGTGVGIKEGVAMVEGHLMGEVNLCAQD